MNNEREILAACGAARRLIVALDFDGTLAPLQDDPANSRILPDGVRALQSLSELSRIHLALVSGRPVDDLFLLAEVPVGTELFGSHGAEYGIIGENGLNRQDLRLSSAQLETLHQIAGQLDSLVSGIQGAWCERKPAANVLHVRLVQSKDDRDRLLTQAREIAHQHGIDALHGKNVLELPILHSTKGDAIRHLHTSHDPATLLYAGDDVTDEHALAALKTHDIGIRIGPGESRAQYRIESPAALCGLLGRMAHSLPGSP